MMDEAIRKAEVLIEALEYIRTFRDRRTVIKLGGSAMEDPEALRATLQDVVFMALVGVRPVLVHGGGKPIDRAMAAAGLQPKKIQGRRVTDEATLEIVVRVLCHEINAGIVKQIRELGGRAVGLHSDAMQALFGEKLMLPGDDGKPIDLGRVGKVTRVDRSLIDDLCAGGVVPVIPSVALDAEGKWLNVNADMPRDVLATAYFAYSTELFARAANVLGHEEDARKYGALADEISQCSIHRGCHGLLASTARALA